MGWPICPLGFCGFLFSFWLLSQSIPVRNDYGRSIRKAFIAKPGYILISADYEQIELRIIAALSGDKSMQDGFCRGDDVHTITARQLFGLSQDMTVTKEQRNRAKAVSMI